MIMINWERDMANEIITNFLHILVILCMGRRVGGRVSTDCTSENNPIVLKTCTVESTGTGVYEIVPCKLHVMTWYNCYQ